MVAECKSSLVLNVKFLRREHFRPAHEEQLEQREARLRWPDRAR